MRDTTTHDIFTTARGTALATIEGEWQDVDGWRNLTLLLLAAVILGVDPALLYREMPGRLQQVLPGDILSHLRGLQRELRTAERTGRRKKAERLKNRAGERVKALTAGLRGHKMALPEYNRVLGAMRHALGHVSRLAEVGACSVYVGFGADALKKKLNDLGGWLVSSAAMVYSLLGEGSDLWNENKAWDSERIAPGHWRLFSWYLPGKRAGVDARDCMDDWMSMYWLIRGMNQALPAMFARNPNGALEVSYKVAQLPLRELIEAELPGVTWEVRSGRLHLVGPGMSQEPYGQIVWLTPDENGLYIGAYELEPSGENSVMAVRLTRDLLSPCDHQAEGTPTQYLPLALAGETYMLDRDQGMVPATVIEVKWKPNLGDYLPGFTSVATQVRREHAAAHARRELVTVRGRLAWAELVIRSMFPNMATAMKVIKRVVLRSMGREVKLYWSQRDIVVFIDVVGSERIQQSMQAGEVARRVQAMFDGMRQAAARHGAWLYKEMGDGAVFILTDGFGTVGACDCEELGLQKLAHNALDLAQELVHVARRELDADIRVGIDFGENTWRVQGAGLLEVTGLPTTRAARLESCGRPGVVLVSPEFRELANGGVQFFTGPDEFAVKHGRKVTAFTYVLPDARVRELVPPGDSATAK